MRVPAENLVYDDLYYLDGKPFTGVAYIMDDSGDWVQGEIEFKDGSESGVKREWWETGKLAYEGTLRGGRVHGKKRRWHYNGQLAEEGEYEYGIPVRERSWDEEGQLLEDYQLRETDPDYQRIQRYRAQEQEAIARDNLNNPET